MIKTRIKIIRLKKMKLQNRNKKISNNQVSMIKPNYAEKCLHEIITERRSSKDNDFESELDKILDLIAGLASPVKEKIFVEFCMSRIGMQEFSIKKAA